MILYLIKRMHYSECECGDNNCGSTFEIEGIYTKKPPEVYSNFPYKIFEIESDKLYDEKI
jgi:hypothetical protein